jgi:multiple sugar transport system substrate-binding protein
MGTGRSTRGLLGVGAVGAVALLAVTSGVSAASSSHSSRRGEAAPIVLTEEDYYTSGSALDGWNTLIKEYEKLHPNVTIKRSEIPQDSYIPDVLSQASSGSLPDIVMIDNPYVPELASTGVLTPLQSLGNLPVKDIAPTELYDGYYKGVLYALPMYTNTNGLFYNKTMFAAHHLTPPKTWAQLEADAKLLTTKSVSGFVTALDPEGDAAYWSSAPFIWTNAGVDYTAHVNSPAVVAAVNVFVTMAKDGSMPKAVVEPSYNADDVFDAGKAAMEQSGPWTIATKNAVKGLDYGSAELPTRTGHQKLLVPTGGETWTIPKTDSSAAAQAAFQYLKWLDTPATDVQEAVLQGGLVPTLKAAVAPALAKEDAAEMEPFAEELLNGGTPRTLYLGTAFDSVSTTVGNAIDAAVVGTATTEQALTSIVSTVQSEIQKAKAS